jgi:methyl-accepting chemotaxis protein
MRMPLMLQIGRIFKKDHSTLPLQREVSKGEIARVSAKRTSFFRPWAKRDAAIASMQEGLEALAGVMTNMRDNIEKQGRRQDEMLAYLSHLPEILHSLPEAHRIQAENLKTISQQIQQQTAQTNRVGEILEKLSSGGVEQKETLEAIKGEVATMGGHSEHVASNLRHVGDAMEGVTRNSERNAQVLELMHEKFEDRSEEMERRLKRQGVLIVVLVVVSMLMAGAAGGVIFWVVKHSGG